MKNKIKILLIEDDIPSLKALAATLKMLGFDSEAFSDPEEAIARFQANNDFDVVITDLKMPKIRGIEVLDRIRSLGSKIPMIIITAYRDHIQLNADRIFYKPIDINGLVNYLKQL